MSDENIELNAEATAEDLPESIRGPIEDEFVLPEAKGRTDRNAAMKDIVGRRHREINASLESVGLKKVEFGKTEEDEPAAEEPVAVEPPAPLSGDEAEVTLADGRSIRVPVSNIKTKVKIDGEEEELPLDTVRSGFQKDQTASKRLELAASKLKEIEMRSQQPPPPSKDADKPVVNTREEAEKLLDSLYSDDRETAVKGIEKLLLSTQKPTQEIKPEEIETRVVRQIDAKNAFQAFKRDYPEIIADPHLLSMADKFAEIAMRENPNASHEAAFKEAGESVRSWLQKFQPKPEVKVELQSRVEEKKAAQKPLPPTTRRASIGEDAPKRKTAADIIADLKRGRGQAF